MIYTLTHIGYLSLFIGLMPLLVILTLGFRYTVLIEARVATERGGISAARYIWQGKIIGRLMRSSNVFAYLIFRAIPFPFFQQRASLLGDPAVSLPRSWQAWVITPMLLMYLAVITTLVTNLVIQSVK
ncbi:hypothetical protein ABWH88_16530 [Marinobacter adhaerens]|jgi:hypothetical protein|uniref:Uncharacterized protein n=1 Tax=Marinobacter adhaerens TaxID=1033846 RepID=A0ABX8IJ10_9GAMM|nr:hypothetical protein [Marinobacter adhaerens]MBW4976808.1 hypothetical protein [Marinobacter adhaerens]QWV12671.1 hypothetical protein KQ249_18690 [Marinobacter adhaerens]